MFNRHLNLCNYNGHPCNIEMDKCSMPPKTFLWQTVTTLRF